MNINFLPDDVLFNIFGQLDLKSRAFSERVCRRWKLLMTTVHLLQPVNYKLGIDSPDNLESYSGHSPLKRGQRRNTFQEAVFILNLKEATKFLRKNSHGKELTLSLSKLSQIKPVLTAIRRWPKLEKLDIEIQLLDQTVCAIDRISRHVVSTVVTRIYVNRCEPRSPLRDGDLKNIFTSCPNLVSLILNCHHTISVHSLVKLPSQLRTLMIEHLHTFPIGPFLAGDAKQLEEFKLILDAPEYMEEICKTMTQLTTLAFQIEDDYHNMNDHLWPLANLEHLESLAFNHLPGGDDDRDVAFTQYTEPCDCMIEALLDVLSKCTKLKHLAVSQCCLTKEFYKELPQAVPQLELLHEYFYDENDYRCKVTKKCFNALLSMNNLKSVTIHVDKSKGRDILNFVKLSTSLRHFGLRGLSKQTAAKILNLMIEKAKENGSQQYYLDVHLNVLLSILRKLPPNLKLGITRFHDLK